MDTTADQFTQTLQWLISTYPILSSVLVLLSSLCTFCSALAKVLPAPSYITTPITGSKLRVVKVKIKRSVPYRVCYRICNWLALNFGNTANIYDPKALEVAFNKGPILKTLTIMVETFAQAEQHKDAVSSLVNAASPTKTTTPSSNSESTK